jgi:hypothetical protein
MLTKTEIIEMDAHSSAMHEIAHAIVAEHFGLDAYPTISLRDTQHDDLSKCYVGGYTEIIGLGRTAFRHASIGFAGYAAYAIAETDDDAWDIYEGFFEEEQSDTDMASINRHHQQWRACKTACSILKKHKTALIERAADLASAFLAALPRELRREMRVGK